MNSISSYELPRKIWWKLKASGMSFQALPISFLGREAKPVVTKALSPHIGFQRGPGGSSCCAARKLMGMVWKLI